MTLLDTLPAPTLPIADHTANDAHLIVGDAFDVLPQSTLRPLDISAVHLDTGELVRLTGRSTIVRLHTWAAGTWAWSRSEGRCECGAHPIETDVAPIAVGSPDDAAITSYDGAADGWQHQAAALLGISQVREIFARLFQAA